MLNKGAVRRAAAMPQSGAGIDKWYCKAISMGYARAIGNLAIPVHDVSEQHRIRLVSGLKS
jgi:hypothetical protein